MKIVSFVWTTNDHENKICAAVETIVIDGRLEFVPVLS